MSIYNRYGAINEPFGSECNKIAYEASQRIAELCITNELSSEDTTICFHYVISAILSREAELRLRKAMAMRKKERQANTDQQNS